MVIASSKGSFDPSCAPAAVGLMGHHIHVDLKTGKAVRPEEQKYLDESGQPLGTSYASLVSDDELPNKTAPTERQ